MPPTNALRLIIQMPALNAMNEKILSLIDPSCAHIYAYSQHKALNRTNNTPSYLKGDQVPDSRSHQLTCCAR